MPKRGYIPEEHRVLDKLVEKHGTEGSAWKAIENDFNEEVKGYHRTAGALRTEYFRHTQLRGVPKKDKTIQGIIRKLGILENRLSRRSAESGTVREDRKEKRELRKENRDLKRSKRALEAELGKVRRALRPFQRAIERAQSARVVHSETKR